MFKCVLSPPKLCFSEAFSEAMELKLCNYLMRILNLLTFSWIQAR
jgi:hypothetical protein